MAQEAPGNLVLFHPGGEQPRIEPLAPVLAGEIECAAKIGTLRPYLEGQIGQQSAIASRDLAARFIADLLQNRRIEAFHMQRVGPGAPECGARECVDAFHVIGKRKPVRLVLPVAMTVGLETAQVVVEQICQLADILDGEPRLMLGEDVSLAGHHAAEMEEVQRLSPRQPPVS